MQKLISISDSIFIESAYGIVDSEIYRIINESGYGNKDNGGIIFNLTRKLLNIDKKRVVELVSKLTLYEEIKKTIFDYKREVKYGTLRS